jgi:hypothetical protein
MHSAEQTIATSRRNWLLRALPLHEYELLASHLEPVRLETGDVVIDLNTPIERVYFPDTGVISSLSVTDPRKLL